VHGKENTSPAPFHANSQPVIVVMVLGKSGGTSARRLLRVPACFGVKKGAGSDLERAAGRSLGEGSRESGLTGPAAARARVFVGLNHGEP
jgi:hypothetical protein